MTIRGFLLATAGFFAAAATAHAQCVGSTGGVTTIDNCAAAVSVQTGDKVFGWQNAQNPHTRKITVGQILGALNTGTQVTSPSTTDSLVMAPNGTTPRLVSIGTIMAMLAQPTIANGVAAAGSAQGGATALTSRYNVISTVASGAGVILPACNTPPVSITIIDQTATVLSVYPDVGSQIQSGPTSYGANNPIAIPAYGKGEFLCVSSGLWIAS